jgi:hypothetical protein
MVKMERHSRVIVIAMLSLITIISCKKDKDYNKVIKNKTWWGQLTNPGELPQYYSMYFKEDGSLIWSQRLADYTGKWVVNNNQLTMDFLLPAVQIKADISDDNKLTNMTANNSSVVSNANLIANPAITLDNSVWNGTLYVGVGPSQSLQLIFLSGSKLNVTVSGASIGGFYTRSESGAVIRFTVGAYPFFGIISSDKDLIGQWYNAGSYDKWQTTKQ